MVDLPYIELQREASNVGLAPCGAFDVEVAGKLVDFISSVKAEPVIFNDDPVNPISPVILGNPASI